MTGDRDLVAEARLVAAEIRSATGSDTFLLQARHAAGELLGDLAAEVERLRACVTELGDHHAGYAVTIADELCSRYVMPSPVMSRAEAARSAWLNRRAEARVVVLREMPGR